MEKGVINLHICVQHCSEEGQEQAVLLKFKWKIIAYAGEVCNYQESMQSCESKLQ